MEIVSRVSLFSKAYGWWQSQPWTKSKVEPFIEKYHINDSEFVRRASSFKSFNDFFTRKLKTQARPIDGRRNVAVIPADARYWFYQDISEVDGFVVKGKKFDIGKLLNDSRLAEKYAKGSMAIARLCPSDYHRYHFPCSGIPSPSDLINGYLYSVNPLALQYNLSIFTENKRTLCHFRTDEFGEVLILDVGATFVGAIHQTYKPGAGQDKGSEKGYFSFGGSCLILLFEPGKIKFDQDLVAASKSGKEIRCLMGQSMGSIPAY